MSVLDIWAADAFLVMRLDARQLRTPPAAPRSSPQVRLIHCRYPNHKAADAIMPLYYVKTLISRLGAVRSVGGCHRESQRAGDAR